MQQIKNESIKMSELPVNSIILEDRYIIPGSNGRKVDIDSSFIKMHKDNTYNIDKYVFTFIKPDISLEENKDKIIIRGNNKNNAVSLIFESFNDSAKYIKQKNYKANVLISDEKYDLYYELINNSNNEEIYSNIDSFLNKHRVNSNICLLKNDKVPSLCKDKYIVKPSLTITHSNVNLSKNKISSGEIILIKDSVTINDLDLILKEIKYHDLSLKNLSTLIKE